MATTLENLLTLTRERSNMENNNFVSDDELTTYLNNSLGELDDVLATDYEDYRLNTFQSALNTTNIIPIPSNLYKLRAVDYQVSPTEWITLFPFQLTQRNQQNRMPAAQMNRLNNLYYRLGDAGIIIMPAAKAAGIYQIWFTPKFVPLALTTDTLTIQMDTQAWIEYAIVDCCIKIFNKQNLDPSGFMAEKGALLGRIRNAAKNRDSAGPKSIANVRFNDMDGGLPFGWDQF